MFSIDSFCKEYKPNTVELAIRGKKFDFYVPNSIETFLDSEDMLRNFPLWSKIWESCLILGDFLAGMPVEPEKHFLEIGAGLGVSGITAAAFGHRFTSTEYDLHALNFLRANVERNTSLNPLEIIRLDWNNPSLNQAFDYIVGSDVVYSETFFQPLSMLLKRYLKSDGEIILATEMRQTSMKFLEFMQESYDIKVQRKVLHKKDKDISVIFCKMKPQKRVF